MSFAALLGSPTPAPRMADIMATHTPSVKPFDASVIMGQNTDPKKIITELPVAYPQVKTDKVIVANDGTPLADVLQFPTPAYITDQKAPEYLKTKNKGFNLLPAHILKLWRERPLIFLKDVFDATPHLWQEECIEIYRTKNRLGMIASKGVGKTWLLSAVTWHFMATRYIPKIAALSITKDHLMSNLWAELLRLRDQSDVLKLATTDGAKRIALKGKEGFSFIDARSFPKSANADEQASSLAGLHADNVMFVIDEAGSMPDAILITADAALSTGDTDTKCARLVVTANPEQPKGILYKASKGEIEDWNMYRISGDPDDPKRSPAVDRKWAANLIKLYGREDPFVMVNVLGQYPSIAAGSLLSEEEINAAMERDIPIEEVMATQTRLGVDVARDGMDRTIFFKRKGLKAWPAEDYPSTIHGPELAGKIMLMFEDHRTPDYVRPERVIVDSTGGFGSSVIDSLVMANHMIDVSGVNYASSAQDSRYANKRTEMWVRMRDWIRAGGCLPRDTKLLEELMMPKLFFHGGVFKLEPKEMIKGRLGRSPDRADALAQTFADVDAPSIYSDQYSQMYSGKHSAVAGYKSDYSSGRHISEKSDLDFEQSNPYARHAS